MIFHWQTILIKNHTYFLLKTRKDVAKFVVSRSAAVVIGALMVNPCPVKIFFVQKILTDYNVCCINSVALQTNTIFEANAMNPRGVV